MITLFPDQIEVVNKLRSSMRYSKSVLMQASTGSGKTIMSSYLVSSSQSKGNRTWFVVPRKELLRQTATTFEDFDIPYGHIASGMDYNPFSRNFICSAQTLVKRLQYVQPPHLVIWDEAHYGGDGNDVIINWLKSHGCWIVGLSATPWKLSGMGLKCWFDRMVAGPTTRWLIDNKRLSDYRLYAPNRPDLSSIKTTAGDYAKGDLASFMESQDALIGDAVKHYKQHAMGKLGITYTVSRKHSEMMAQRYRDAGVPAAHMDGETPDNERKRIIRAFANRELLQLTNVQLLTFGFDLSAQVGTDVTVETMHDLAPTKSLALELQKWGRVLRNKPEPALIFDHASNVHTHGFPCDDREWTLEDRERKARGESEKTIAIRTCPQCFYTHKPAPCCPRCEFEYPIKYRDIEEVEGDLKQLNAEDVIRENAAKRQEVGRARTLDDLRRIQRERGYKTSWVFQIARVKGITK